MWQRFICIFNCLRIKYTSRIILNLLNTVGWQFEAASIRQSTEFQPCLATSGQSRRFGVPDARTGSLGNTTWLIYFHFKPFKNLSQCFAVVLLDKMDVGALGIKYLRRKRYPGWSRGDHLGNDKTVREEHDSKEQKPPSPSLHQRLQRSNTRCLLLWLWALKTGAGALCMVSISSPVSCVPSTLKKKGNISVTLPLRSSVCAGYLIFHTSFCPD